MAVLLPLFIGLAVAGLVLSLVSHVCGLLGLPQPLGAATWGLHIGAFIVWLPAVVAANHLAKDFKQKDAGRAVLRGCPQWMRWLTFAFGVYAVVNFVTFIAAAPPGRQGAGAGAPPVVFRGFSGHWMLFYAMALAVLYSALVTRERDRARRCPNAHPVSPSAVYCEECGARVEEPDYIPIGEGAV